ncbi:S-adenosyl-L-methionine-dependent methyltransferase [Dipodascopsis uninucleata]
MNQDSSSFVVDKPGYTEFRVVEAEIIKLGSTGDGLGIYEEKDKGKRVIVVPFTVPGDRVRAKIVKDTTYYSSADFVELLQPGEKRNDSLIKCKYFGKCAGCQLQMYSYEDQLSHKRRVIENAYKHLCNVDKTLIPEIGSTIGSPLQYSYRTKLTPHFDVPRNGLVPGVLPIGFTQKGRSFTIDIEECAIATPALNKEYSKERSRIKDNLHSFKRGATLLLRESSKSKDGTLESKTVCTDSKDVVNEFVNDYQFNYPAGDFFQCNSSVLPQVTEYVNVQLKLPIRNQKDGERTEADPPKYLVDAYCGSGLFSITCNDSVEKVIGVEISANSVKFASKNAELNGITNSNFILGDAAVIFKEIETPSNQTSMILDPPRKGCGSKFLDQLLAYLPKRIVYVSCNVHTQARDISYILNDPRGKDYEINSICGFDFFPQTYHVESVAVLTLKS